MGICPVCDGEVLLPEPRKGEVVTCPECAASLLVVSVSPLILEELDEEEEEELLEEQEESAEIDEEDEDEEL